MLLLATSDRPDTSAPEPPPERTPEVEPREPEPEIAPREPDAPERRTPETEPPDRPDTTPPETPEIAPPSSPEIAPPSSPEISPPDSPEIVPPTPPEIAPPVDVAAPARPSPPEPEAKRHPLQRAALALLVIAAAALIGYALSRPGDRDAGRDAGPDAVTRSLEAAGRLRLVLKTDTPAEARQFVRDEFGWRVGVPVFEAAALHGVAIAQTAPAVEVPVFLYADAEGRDVAVFAYSYALLDQVPDRLRLTTADYDDLDEGAPFVRPADGQDVILWRDRDDIYVAITDFPPDALTGGLAMAR